MKNFGKMIDDAKARSSYINSDLDGWFGEWVNDGIQQIGRRFIWPFLEGEGTITTAATTTDGIYDLAEDVAVLYLMRNITSNRKLEFITLRAFYNSIANPIQTGVPYNYHFTGTKQAASSDTPVQQVGFYPIPDSVQTIKYPYYKRLAFLANDTDISIIPAQFHELPVDYAASVYFAKKGDPRAVTHNDKFENGLLDMAEQLGAKPVDAIDVVGSLDEMSGPRIVKLPSSFGSTGFRF